MFFSAMIPVYTTAFELETTLPYAAEDLVIDFHTLDGTTAGEQTELIAAAIEKSKLSPYMDALASIQADPEKLTLSGLPTALCLANQADPEEDQLFIEIDDTYGTLFVLAGGRLQLIRSFPLPTAGPSKAPQLCAQIQQTLAAFLESSELNFEPIEVLVNGIGLDEMDIIPQLSRTLDIPVKTASIADRLNIPMESNAESPWIPAQMDNALALALMEVEGYDGLNFHKGQFVTLRFTPLPYEQPLMFNAQIRGTLPTADAKGTCLGMQIVGLEASPEGHEMLQQLCNVVEQYYQINQSGAKQRDVQAAN